MSTSMIPKLARMRAGELKGYDISGATVHFTLDKPLPAALVTRLVKERIAENEKTREKVRRSRMLFFSSCPVGLCSLSGLTLLVRNRRF